MAETTMRLLQPLSAYHSPQNLTGDDELTRVGSPEDGSIYMGKRF